MIQAQLIDPKRSRSEHSAVWQTFFLPDSCSDELRTRYRDLFEHVVARFDFDPTLVQVLYDFKSQVRTRSRGDACELVLV